ncbi:TniQ family protein [Actinacidiphila reveromycinica]|uniref:TniQ family protein n=1 Tax=Actinacidiphila reveromycinica TaxID=659352 RepID=UPI001F1A2591|nr:TniQ family protein [Streptomyces sp. SN-593]
MRPLPGEATASYTTRLAAAYRLPLPHLLDGLGIHLNPGPGSTNGAAPTAELHLNLPAAARLAAHARTPQPHLLRALPRLAPGPHERPAPTSHTPAGPPAAHWQPLEPAHRPVRACTACVLHRSRGTSTAWIHPPDHTPALCTRHQQAADDPRHTAPLDIAALPELTRAHHQHRRAARHPAFTTALTWAATITTRWYDHHQHLTDRWHTRLTRLTTTNPHTQHGPASPTLTCRTLITYPETLTLAATLTRIPPHGLTPNAQARFLHHLADQLEINHLTPATHDPLWTRIHTR